MLKEHWRTQGTGTADFSFQDSVNWRTKNWTPTKPMASVTAILTFGDPDDTDGCSMASARKCSTRSRDDWSMSQKKKRKAAATPVHSCKVKYSNVYFYLCSMDAESGHLIRWKQSVWNQIINQILYDVASEPIEQQVPWHKFSLFSFIARWDKNSEP